MRRSTLLTVATAAGLCFAVSASAVPISIVNPSFEMQPLADGVANTGNAAGWTESPAGGSLGWYNPNQTSYTHADIVDTNPSGGTLGDMDGKNAAYNISDGGSLSQILTTSVLVGWDYTLTVAVGDRDAGPRPDFGGYRIDLLDGDSVIATTGNVLASPGNGTFTDVSLFYTAQAGDAGLLEIRLTAIGLAGSTHATDFDNVRLDAIPEPGTAMLVLLGLSGLALRRRR